MPGTNGNRPIGAYSGEDPLVTMIDAVRLLETKRNAPVKAEELQRWNEIYIRVEKERQRFFVFRFASVLHDWAEQMNGCDADPEASFEEYVSKLESREDLQGVYTAIAGGLEKAAEGRSPHEASASQYLALQARRVVATVTLSNYLTEDNVAALSAIAEMLGSSFAPVRETGRRLLAVIPRNEQGLLEMPLFMRSLVKAFLFSGQLSAELTLRDSFQEWREYLQSKTSETIKPPAFGSDVTEDYTVQMQRQIGEFADKIIAELGGQAETSIVQSLAVLLDRGDVVLASDFIRVFHDFTGRVFPKNVFALLLISAARENVSFERAMLTEDAVRLAVKASAISNGQLRNGILPLLVAYISGSDTHKEVDGWLSRLIERLSAPALFPSEYEGAREAGRPFDIGDADASEFMDASDLELLVYHFLNNLVHHWNVTNSLAARLLNAAGRDILNGARIWLISKALYQDMLQGTRHFDQAKLNRYLAPLLDEDPRVQNLIESSRFRRSGPNNEFFESYDAVVRARQSGAVAPGGASVQAAEEPEELAELPVLTMEDDPSTVRGLAETGESSGAASNSAPARATRRARRSNVQHRQTTLFGAGAAVQRGALRTFGVPFARTPVRTPGR